MVIRHAERDFVTYVRGNMDFSICQKETGGSYAEGYTTGDEVWLMIGFSVDETEACRLSALEACAEMEKVADYCKSGAKTVCAVFGICGRPRDLQWAV